MIRVSLGTGWRLLLARLESISAAGRMRRGRLAATAAGLSSLTILTALDFATGRMLWRDRSVGKGAVAYADGRLYMLSENHVVGLAEVTPSGYRETGRFEIADQGLPSWSHPVISGGRMYLRNQGVLAAYDVRANRE